ncbi:MAG: hypothetical protein ABR970_03570 [Roseiarcus sp.]
MLDRFAAAGPGNLGVLAVDRDNDPGHAAADAFDLVAGRAAVLLREGGVERGPAAAILDPSGGVTGGRGRRDHRLCQLALPGHCASLPRRVGPQAEIRDSANAACVRPARKLAWSARRPDRGKFTFGAPVATTAAEAALSAGAEAAGRCVCAAG